ncbi:hypothetical protein ACFWCA_19040 [Streptomyces phaeochromogenes]|uniref:hypothetical protein n=1 Tax=Streptomyces phaeochromogenes TaxID=1923 RepID=UPI00369D2A0E
MTATIQTRICSNSDELYCWYAQQSGPQPAYIELGLEDGVFLASYDAIIGSGAPGTVFHGIDRRWAIPVLTGDATNRLLVELQPLAERILAGSHVEFDGNNRVGRIVTPDANEAFEAISARCEGLCEEEHGLGEDLLPVWHVDSMGDLWTASDAGITAATTDEELDTVTARMLAEFREGMSQQYAVVEGLHGYLRGLRDEARDEDAD